jgi:hypothetical protein
MDLARSSLPRKPLTLAETRNPKELKFMNAYTIIRDHVKIVSPAPPQEYPWLFAKFIAAATCFDSWRASTSRPTCGTNCCSSRH